MTAGPLDQDGGTASPRAGATTIPRIRNPVVESWNEDDEPLPRGPSNRIPGASPYTAPPSVASVLASPAVVPQTSAKRFVPVLLVLALFLLGSAFIEMTLAALPVQTYLASWRYSVVGAISTKMLPPLAAVTLITAALMLEERARVAKVFAVLLTVLGVAILPLMLFYLLDAIQVRLGLESALRGKVFLVAVGKTMALYVGAALVLLTNAFVLYRAAKQWAKSEFSVGAWHR